MDEVIYVNLVSSCLMGEEFQQTKINKEVLVGNNNPNEA